MSALGNCCDVATNWTTPAKIEPQSGSIVAWYYKLRGLTAVQSHVGCMPDVQSFSIESGSSTEGML